MTPPFWNPTKSFWSGERRKKSWERVLIEPARLARSSCAVGISFVFRPRKLVVVILEMGTVPEPRLNWGRLLIASSWPLLEYVASKPPWNEWLLCVQLTVSANCISGLELNLGFCLTRA